MARQQFALNTEPHVAEIGDTELQFRPEIMGDEFLDAYTTLRDAQTKLAGDPEDLDIDRVREANTAIRDFLADLMLPDSAQRFRGMQLPSRIYAQLLEWVLELYGGGERPPTSSPASAPPSPRAGRPGTGASRSRASTSTRGR